MVNQARYFYPSLLAKCNILQLLRHLDQSIPVVRKFVAVSQSVNLSPAVCQRKNFTERPFRICGGALNKGRWTTRQIALTRWYDSTKEVLLLQYCGSLFSSFTQFCYPLAKSMLLWKKGRKFQKSEERSVGKFSRVWRTAAPFPYLHRRLPIVHVT